MVLQEDSLEQVQLGKYGEEMLHNKQMYRYCSLLAN